MLRVRFRLQDKVASGMMSARDIASTSWVVVAWMSGLFLWAGLWTQFGGDWGGLVPAISFAAANLYFVYSVVVGTAQKHLEIVSLAFVNRAIPSSEIKLCAIFALVGTIGNAYAAIRQWGVAGF